MMDDTFDFQAMFADSPVAKAIFNNDLRVILVNDAYCALVGRSRKVVLGAYVLDLFPGEPAAEKLVLSAFKQALAGKKTKITEIEYAIVMDDTRDGSKENHWWSVDCIPLPRNATHGACFMVRLENVTAQVMARRTNKLIADELQHRIGNVMTLIQIIARKTAKTAVTLDDFLHDFEDRIIALGKTHSFLSGENREGMTLRQVLDQQLNLPSLPRRGTVRVEGPDWHLSVLHAQTFAMAVHELTVNALKYGALGIDGGEVVVTWDHPSDGSYNFVWKEHCQRGVDFPENDGFGMQMLMRFLPAQLGGHAARAFTDVGFHYGLVIPQDVTLPVGQQDPTCLI